MYPVIKAQHGGDIVGFTEKHGSTPIDFSSNISPLGVPNSVVNAIREFAPYVDKYPDPFSRRLKGAISTKFKIPETHILCGNGAADLIYRITLSIQPKHALIVSPTFSEYETALKSVDCDIKRYLLKEEKLFQIQEDFLDHLTPDLNVVFICNPNNPTGTLISRNFLTKILECCKRNNTFVILDECFIEFIDDPKEFSLISKLDKYNNLIILNAFTKIYGLAGIRLGCCFSSNTLLLSKIESVSQPWSVSSIAEVAGIAALNDDDYVKRVRGVINEEKSFLYDSLIKLKMDVIPPKANFILFKSEFPLKDYFEERGILIRECDNFYGLSNLWNRIAVKKHSENANFLCKLEEVLNEKS